MAPTRLRTLHVAVVVVAVAAACVAAAAADSTQQSPTHVQDHAQLEPWSRTHFAAVATAAQVTVQGGVPVIVDSASSGYLWFPQTMHAFTSLPSTGGSTANWSSAPIEGGDPVSPVLVLAVQTCEDEAHPEGWSGANYVSTDAGATWSLANHVPELVKACFPVQNGTSAASAAAAAAAARMLCLPYPLRPSPTDPSPRVQQQAGHIWTALRASHSAPVTVAMQAAPVSISYTGFTHDVRPWGTAKNLSIQVTDGGFVTLKDGSFLMGIYGDYSGPDSAAITAMVSDSTSQARSWKQVGIVANSSTAPQSCANPTEHDFERLADGRLMAVYRTGTNKPLCKAYSSDEGATWTTPQPMPAGGPHGVEPKLLRLPNGLLVVSAGRYGIFLWVCSDGVGDAWTAFNVAAHHNAMVTDPALKYDQGFVNATSDKGWSTSYTSIAAVDDSSLVYCYDRLTNGWKPPPGPWGTANYLFCVHLTVSASV